MKRKVFGGMALVMLLATMLISPAAAKPLHGISFSGHGWFISTTDSIPQEYRDLHLGTLIPSEGDKCNFSIAGGIVAGQESGSGSWVDKDWHEGSLTAVLSVRDVDERGLPNGFIQLHGTADVFINKQYKATYTMFLELFEVGPPHGDFLRIYLWDPLEGIWELPDPVAQCYYIAGGGLSGGKIKIK